MWPDSRKPSEPLWLPEDIEAVLERQRERNLLCGGCGHPVDETMDPDNEEKYWSEPITCHACAAIDREKHRRENTENADLMGIKFQLHRVEDD